MTKPATTAHPLYSFVSIGREVDLLEPCPFDDTPVDSSKWLVLVEAPGHSSRRYEGFAHEPTFAQAEEFLFSEKCSGLVSSWLQEAHDTSNSELAAALRGNRRLIPGEVSATGLLARVEVQQPLRRFGSPRAYDDVKTRAIFALGSSLLGLLTELVESVSAAGMPLEREATTAVVDCLGTGVRWLTTLNERDSSDAAAYMSAAMTDVDADFAYLESESFDFAQAIPVLRDVREAMALEAHLHAQSFAECLRSPRRDGSSKVAFTTALLRETLDLLTRYVIEQRTQSGILPSHGGLNIECTAALGVALFLMSTLFSAANICDSPSDQAGYDTRWPLQSMEPYLRDLEFMESSGEAWGMVKSVYDALGERFWVVELDDCGEPVVAG